MRRISQRRGVMVCLAPLPAKLIPSDGQGGLRVNHNVNIHVTTLDVTQHVP